MEIFVFWVFIIVILLVGYSYYLIRRSPKGFRLQVKLTIIFILLVLVPAIPLTFFVSALLTQGVEIFLIPGVERSLDESLQVIKFQLEEKGLSFIRNHSDWSILTASDLHEHDILFAAKYQLITGSRRTLCEFNTMESAHFQVGSDTLALALEGEISSTLRELNGKPACFIYQAAEDSIVNVVGFYLNESVLLAKDRISESLKIYKSLSLLKKSVIEGRLIWGIATVFIIFMALIAIYTARILSRGISEPIQQLAAGMQRVATGDLSSKVVVKAKDEVKILVDSFNKMADDLIISQQNLVKAERLAAWRDIARRVSHEIKNSLTPIQISLYRIKNKFLTEIQETDEDPLKSIEEEIESLKKIADEFSQFARMPQIKREENDVNSMIKTLIPLIEGSSKPVKINLELDSSLPKLSIDRDQMKRVLQNLIKNSIEASEVGAAITVKTSFSQKAGRTVRIEIIDYGHGMEKNVQSKIFKPYFTTKERGMGLGLSIVKRIIEDHDGDISVKSEKGKGTQVIIDL